ncbi:MULTISPECIES: hypothetical protein [unclassified Streptomyces]|uniref:hypothetical protein n=1 Tax=unclassified Streptomyces TaxID=2593676 RepID=UPI003D942346
MRCRSDFSSKRCGPHRSTATAITSASPPPVPLTEKYVTAAEWKQLGEHGLANSPKKTLPLALGMAMDEGDPEVVKAVLADAPLAARLIMPVLGPRRYAAHAKRVHGTSTPPRIGD